MKTNKKKYCVSRQSISNHKKVSKNKKEKEDIILVHKIAVEGLSRAMAEELLGEYVKNLPKKHGKLNIMNYILPMTESCKNPKTDIKMIYPVYSEIRKELFEHLSKEKQRKLKIFELLNENE